MSYPRGSIESGCRCCGTCCRKGGPALHIEDREWVTSGTIPLAALMTIRRHEPSYDNVIGRLVPAATDIIKVKAHSAQRQACRFYRFDPPGCSIYAQRPLECHALQCWDTRDIEAIYQRDRLTRQHLLAGHADIWDLIVEHETRCNYWRLARLAKQVHKDKNSATASDSMLAMIRYDQSLRDTVKESTGLRADLLDFLFGRPLTFTLVLFDLQLVKSSTSGSYAFRPRWQGAAKGCPSG